MATIISYQEDKYQLKTLQSKLLDALVIFDDYCSKHNIDYSLYAGTLLGSIRHKGFIPWDDDIDIVMTRPSFMKFQDALEKDDTLYKEGTVDLPLFLHKFYANCAKYNDESLYIDIFILDLTPQNRILRKLKLWTIIFIRELIKGRYNKAQNVISIVRKVLSWFFSFPFSLDKLRSIYTKIAQVGSEQSNLVCSYDAIMPDMGKYIPKELISQYTKASFEGYDFKVFSKNKDFLSLWYGLNWMTPPPVEKRMPRHFEHK